MRIGGGSSQVVVNTGLNAYEMAQQRDNFTGTYAEWKASLKGDPGPVSDGSTLGKTITTPLGNATISAANRASSLSSYVRTYAHKIDLSERTKDCNDFSVDGATVQAILDEWYDNAPKLMKKASFGAGWKRIGTLISTPANMQIGTLDTIDVPPGCIWDQQGEWFANTAGGSLAADPFLPMIRFAHGAHCERGEFRGNHNGDQFACCGTVFGQSFVMASIAPADPGKGYAVGNIVTLPNPDFTPFLPAQAKVDAVDANGGITACSLYTTGNGGGAYAMRPAKQPATFAQASTTGTGTGATFTPTWEGNYKNNAYNPGRSYIIGDTYIGRLRVFGTGENTDATKGPQFAYLHNAMNSKVQEVEVESGAKGIWLRNTVDYHANILNAVRGSDGLTIKSGGSIFINQYVSDSNRRAMLKIDDSAGVNIKMSGFYDESNVSAGAITRTNCVEIGLASGNVNENINIEGMYYNAGIDATTTCKLFYLAKLNSGCIKFMAANKQTNYSGTTRVNSPRQLTNIANISADVGANVKLIGQVEGMARNKLFTTGGTAPTCFIDVWCADEAVVADRWVINQPTPRPLVWAGFGAS